VAAPVGSELLCFTAAAVESLYMSPAPWLAIPFATGRSMLGAAVCGRDGTPFRVAALTVFLACDEIFGSDGAHGVNLDADGALVAAPAPCLPLVFEIPPSGRRGQSSEARSATSLCGEVFCGDCRRERSSRMRNSSVLRRWSTALLPAAPSPVSWPWPIACCFWIVLDSAGMCTRAFASPALAIPVGACCPPVLRVGWAVAGRFEAAEVARAPTAFAAGLRAAPARCDAPAALGALISTRGRRCGAGRTDVPAITRLTGGMPLPCATRHPARFELKTEKNKKKQAGGKTHIDTVETGGRTTLR